MLLCSLVICVSVIIANYVIKKDEQINIIYNGRNYYLDPQEYYFLNKEVKSTKNMRDFYQSLLNL